MRIALAALMALHGIAHLVGFVGSWQLAAPGTIPYKTTILAGHVNVGDAGIKAVGVLWLCAALGFVIAATGTALDRDWWTSAAVTVALASLALSILEWPDARIGVFVNLAILAAVLVGRRIVSA